MSQLRASRRSPRTVICISPRWNCAAIPACFGSHTSSISRHRALRDPDLEVCVYHDARLAEVRSFRGFQRHPQLAKLQSGLKRELDQRWARNMMLNKWLEYCAERGHHF